MLSSLFFQPDFSLLLRAVFAGARYFNGDLSSWEVGKVTNMGESTYTLSPPSPRSGFFFGCFFFPFSLSVAALILCLINMFPFNAPFSFSKCFPAAVSHGPCAVVNGILCLKAAV